jgi:hypothetical protein
MIQGQDIKISVINVKQARHLDIVITKAVHELILQTKQDLLTLCQGKQANDLVITPKGKSNAILPFNLDRKLNLILKHASGIIKNNLKTHSFRRRKGRKKDT